MPAQTPESPPAMPDGGWARAASEATAAQTPRSLGRFPHPAGPCVWAALGIDGLIAILDISLGPDTKLTGAFVIAPVLLAAVEGPAAVAFLALVSLILAALSGLWNDYFLSSDHLIRCGIILAGGALAVIAARARTEVLGARESAAVVVGELRATERRLDAILGSLDEAVTVRRLDGRTVYTNSAAHKLLGMVQAEIDQRDPGAVASRFHMRDEAGNPLRLEDMPSAKVLRGEPAEPLLVHTVRRDTGDEFWLHVKSSPLLDEHGHIEAAVTVLEDLTAVKRAELRMRFLAQAGEVLASSLDYEQTLRNVAGLAVPGLADWCAVDLVDEDGDRVSVAVAHTDPARVQLAEELRRYEPEELDPDQGMGLVLRTARPLLYAKITEEMVTASAVSEEHLALIRQVGFRSALLVPMSIGERTLGVLTLVTADSGRVLGEEDLEFAEQIAARAAVAVENARLYTQRAEVARTLQESLLPDDLPAIPGCEVAALYLPAAQGAEVGGDFYDIWALTGDWMVMVGDVTGKGVEAAAVTSLVRHTARTASEFERDPASVLARVDRTLQRGAALSLCTAVCARLSGNRLLLASGGHPLPLLVRASEVREIGCYGPLLGAFPDPTWTQLEERLQPGDALVFFTDGVPDAVGEDGERFGLRRLTDCLASAAGSSPAELVERLREAVTRFRVGAQADDTAVLVVRYGASDATEVAQPALRSGVN